MLLSSAAAYIHSTHGDSFAVRLCQCLEACHLLIWRFLFIRTRKWYRVNNDRQIPRRTILPSLKLIIIATHHFGCWNADLFVRPYPCCGFNIGPGNYYYTLAVCKCLLFIHDTLHVEHLFQVSTVSCVPNSAWPWCHGQMRDTCAYGPKKDRSRSAKHIRVNLFRLTACTSVKWSAMLLSHHCQPIAGAWISRRLSSAH